MTPSPITALRSGKPIWRGLLVASLVAVVACCGSGEEPVAVPGSPGEGQDAAVSTSSEELPDDADHAVNRNGFVVAGDLWLIGGMAGVRGDWTPLDSATRVRADGEVEEKRDLPLADGHFLTAQWAGLRTDGTMVVLGLDCPVSHLSSDTLSCARRGLMPVLYTFEDSEVTRVELPGVATTDEDVDTTRAYAPVGQTGDTVIVTQTASGGFEVDENGHALEQGPTDVLSIDLHDGSVSSIPVSGLRGSSSDCIVRGDMVAVALTADSGSSTPTLEAARLDVSVDGANWSRLAPIRLPEPAVGGLPSASCTADGVYLTIGYGPGQVFFVPADALDHVDGAVADVWTFEGHAVATNADDGIVVTVRDQQEGGAAAWLHTPDGNWAEVARVDGPREGLTAEYRQFVYVDGEVVDIGPSLSFVPGDQTTVHPVD